LTVNAGTSTISLTGTTQTFVGGGYTYYNLNFGAASTFIITGANTFNDLTDSALPLTVTFPASTATTVSNFSLSGTAGNLVTLNSSTSGTWFTLAKVSGAVSVSYVSIQDSNATGGAWYALRTNGCVDAGNNLGWYFGPQTPNWSTLSSAQSANWGPVPNTQVAGWTQVSDAQTANWQEVVT
jgi:hypothetical protein